MALNSDRLGNKSKKFYYKKWGKISASQLFNWKSGSIYKMAAINKIICQLKKWQFEQKIYSSYA